MINMIVAVDKNFGIGFNNNLLVSIKSDMDYFVRTTNGHVVVMGYNTYLSLRVRPLPNRINVVLTTKNITIEGVIIIHNLDELFSCLGGVDQAKEIYIIGGASVYKQLLPYAERLYVTHVFESFKADVFFPAITGEWALETVTCTKEDILNENPHIFATYKRIDSKTVKLGTEHDF